MPTPTDVLPLYEPEGYRLGVDAGGRGFYGTAPSESQGQGPGSTLPKPSLTGPASVGSSQPKSPQGMGGSVQPSLRQRALSPQELMALANDMEGQFAFQAGPSAVEPTLERDTSVPFWLRKYAEQEGLGK